MIVNIAHQSFDVYIGRGTPFGNPFKSGIDGTRSEVIELYRVWLRIQLQDDEFRKQFMQLKGKILGCHCKPKACHGDVILEELDRMSSPLNSFIG
ncbi:NrdA.1 [Vibrio phage nt-1]|uniref:NrdA.1 n=1 Tax=Vibrio phage nt-1 TaxID=115992 RepID=R9TFC5_9CAUD|nr:hypothetical protein VPFG_00162 [Vibrio phage nt-1]AGN30164.1 NrdA.1 [Vibrio phage nt-1]